MKNLITLGARPEQIKVVTAILVLAACNDIKEKNIELLRLC